MNEPVLAWHFTGNGLRDGSPIPPIGQWLVYDGPCTMCRSGLHASRHPMDALEYAPGSILHRVECEEIGCEHPDKLVCRRRKIIATRDAEKMLWRFAKDQALSVIHLWDAPQVVVDYLKGDDETTRDAARAAAYTATAAYTAAWNAARAAAARNAAWAAAYTDAYTAAFWDAARAAAWDDAWDAARAAAREEFARRVSELFGEKWLPLRSSGG